MQQTITYKPFETNSSIKKTELWIGIVVLTIGLSIVQDYVYSQVQNTGFYIAESMLYNSIWAFLVPLRYVQIRLLKRFNLQRRFVRIGTRIVFSGAFTILHIFIFSTFFISVSYFAFSPTHHFSHIFNAALSNQFYVLVIFYTVVPFVFQTLHREKKNVQKPIEITKNINVKVGLKTISLTTDSIEFIATEKPYSVIHSNEKKYLDIRTLKEFESILSTNNFVRVHRSTIINKKFVKELKSRKNGDYDCILISGKTVRFSRHYRTNWNDILQ